MQRTVALYPGVQQAVLPSSSHCVCVCVSSLKALFSLSEHEHTDLTAEQDEYVHLVKARRAPTDSGHVNKAIKPTKHPECPAHMFGGDPLVDCFTIPSIG